MADETQWSVRGIDQRTRDAVRERARKKGLTVGEALSEILRDVLGPEEEEHAYPEDLHDDGHIVGRRLREQTPNTKPNRAQPSDFSRESHDDFGPRYTSFTRRPTASSFDTSSYGTAYPSRDSTALRQPHLEPTSRLGASPGYHFGADLDALTTAIERMSQRLEISEQRSTMRIAGIDQTILGLAAKLEGVDRGSRNGIGRTEATLDELRSLQEALIERIRRMEGGESNPRNAAALRSFGEALGKLNDQIHRLQERMDGRDQALDHRFEDLAEQHELASATMSRQLSSAIEQSEARMRAAADRAQERLSALESNSAAVAVGVGSLEDNVRLIATRLDSAESATNAAIRSLESSFAALETRLATVPAAASHPDFDVETFKADAEQRFSALSEELRTMISDGRADIAIELAEAIATLRHGGGEAAIRDLQTQFIEREKQQDQALSRIHVEVERISTGLSDRLETLERRPAVDDTALREEIARSASAITRRLEALEERDDDKLRAMSEEIANLADQMEQRILAAEERSTQSIAQFSEHVASISERQEQRRLRVIDELKDVLDSRMAKTDDQLDRIASEVRDQLQTMDQRATSLIQPIQKTLHSLAERVDVLEDSSTPGGFVAPPLVAALTPALDYDADKMSGAALAGPTAPPRGFETPAPEPEAPVKTGADALLSRLAADFGTADEPEPVPINYAPYEPSPQVKAGAFDENLLDLDVEDDFVATAPPEPAHTGVQSARVEPSLPVSIEDFAPPPPRPQYQYDPYADPAPEDEPYAFDEDHGRNRMDAIDALSLDLDAPVTPEELTPAPPRKDDFLAAAREAARQAAKTGGKSVPSSFADPEDQRDRPKTSLVAAGAAAVAVVGIGAYAFMELKPEEIQPHHAPAKGDAVPAQATPSAFVPDDVSVGGDPSTTLEGGLPAGGVLGNAMPPASLEGAVADRGAVLPIDAKAAANGVKLTLAEAAAKGDPIAQFEFGMARLRAGDTALGASFIRKAAASGLVAAQYRLAKLYEKGDGLPRDPAEARRWTERAAFGGNTKAMHDLAMVYADGQGVEQSYPVAVEWFRKAAEYGQPDSQYNLGLLYQEGLGVTANPAEAAFWFAIAARSGDEEANRMAKEAIGKLPDNVAAETVKRVSEFSSRPANSRANGNFGNTNWQPSNDTATPVAEAPAAAAGTP